MDAIEHAVRLLRHVAVDAVENEFGVAENSIKRRAQLVAHIGEELRFVLAGRFKLSIYSLDQKSLASLHQQKAKTGRADQRLRAINGYRQFSPPGRM
jgi:hypothetical protein